MLLDDQVNEDFYYQLKSAILSYAERDIIILMGDLNAKVGSDNAGG